MRRLPVLVLLLVLLPILAAVSSPVTAQDTTARPNVLMIILDDLRHGDLEYMPNVRRHLVNGGTSYSRAYVTDPVCCPSRASILTGRYVHNHHVPTIPAGAAAFHSSGDDQSTIATWLSATGYRTAMIGKYFVTYPDGTNRRFVPPGWERWVADMRGGYYNYDVNMNRKLRSYGETPSDYSTDVESRNANATLAGFAAGTAPFFVYVTPKTPHSPATPAKRHLTARVREPKAPRLPSVNEADVSDKPTHMRENPSLTSREMSAIDAVHVNRQRALISADQMVSQLLSTLAKKGKLANTYVIFGSDNGYLLGEHRIEGKHVPYEKSISVPLVIRGPGIPAGATDDRLVSYTDLAATIADVTGATPRHALDGRSLRPLWDGTATT